MMCVIRFGKKRRLSTRYIGPFEVIKQIDEVAYRLALPPILSNLHDVFYVSMLKKYLYNPSYMLSYESFDIYPKLSYEEKPVKILTRKDKMLCNKIIPLVKVLWCNHAVEEVKSKTEEEMRKLYPKLF